MLVNPKLAFSIADTCIDSIILGHKTALTGNENSTRFATTSVQEIDQLRSPWAIFFQDATPEEVPIRAVPSLINARALIRAELPPALTPCSSNYLIATASSLSLLQRENQLKFKVVLQLTCNSTSNDLSLSVKRHVSMITWPWHRLLDNSLTFSLQLVLNS